MIKKMVQFALLVCLFWLVLVYSIVGIVAVIFKTNLLFTVALACSIVAVIKLPDLLNSRYFDVIEGDENDVHNSK